MVNVWASWCAPCRIEHPLLMELAKRTDIALFGINYKDEPENAARFLGTLGQPFAAVGMDRDGRAAVDWGVYGVPETFIVDGQGIIRYKHIGPLTPEPSPGTLAAEIEEGEDAAWRHASEADERASGALAGLDLACGLCRLLFLDPVHLGGEHGEIVDEGLAVGRRDEREELLVHLLGAGLRHLQHLLADRR